jgi:hypothetical protein
MKDALIPSVMAMAGGSSLMGAIWLHERRREEAMRSSRQRLALCFPNRFDPIQAKAMLSNLSGLPDHVELIAETIATRDGISHALSVPAEVRAPATSILSSILPGRRTESVPVLRGSASLAIRLYIPTPSLFRVDEAEAAVRAMLGGLAALGPGETVVVRWAIRTTVPRYQPPREVPAGPAREIDAAWRRKLNNPGFQVSGLVLVKADGIARARELASHITSIYSARRDLAGQIRTTAERSGRRLMSLPAANRRSGTLTAAELLPLLG